MAGRLCVKFLHGVHVNSRSHLVSNAICYLFMLLLISTACAEEESLGRGFGDDFDWMESLDEAIAKSKENGKPVMLIIHKSWCGACKRLKPLFAASKEILEMSSYFNMVNVADDDEPKGKEYSPDGGYIPRILFLDKAGTMRNDIINKGGNPQYKYFYSDPTEVVASMKVALEVKDEPAAGTDEL